jgi:cytochrome c-type biogenesis protein CcmE
MSPILKLSAGALLMAAAIGYLAYLGAASSWQYYLSVDEAMADGAHIHGKRIRVGGRVRAGSLTIVDDRRHATFVLAGERHMLHATCHCSLPDNLAEGIEVVVEGTFGTNGIHGDKVITRCASKYQPAARMAARNKAPAT